jgi:hypothetical protein
VNITGWSLRWDVCVHSARNSRRRGDSGKARLDGFHGDLLQVVLGARTPTLSTSRHETRGRHALSSDIYSRFLESQQNSHWITGATGVAELPLPE